MLAEMTSEQLTEWQAFTQLDGPFGEDRADVRAGLIASTLVNCWRSRESRPAKIKDFILTWDRDVEEEERIRNEVMKAEIKRINALLGGSFK